MLFYSVTFGCSEPADCIRCEDSPCYYEPLVTVCLWGCCQSRWVMQTCWSLIQYTENCFCGGRLFSLSCSIHYRNISLDKFTQRPFNNIHCSLNRSNLNVFIIAKRTTETHQWLIIGSSNNIIDDLLCVFPPKYCQH